ncbi:MAG: hypothetical protein AB7J30_17425 [Hyphomicrobium sp.]|uniref:hypothetical protein n=1 Tax=Hyphomicrobium sp. TaxID=82 RepID=UPI003D13A38E
MARQHGKEMRRVVRAVSPLEKRYLGLRTEARKLRREELALWRKLETLIGGKSGRFTKVEHRPGKKDKITHQPRSASESLSAVARARGSSGLFCGCSPIRLLPQPNGDLDVCILVGCSNDPATTGFRCEYWCATLEAEPVVAIARQARRRRTAR